MVNHVLDISNYWYNPHAIPVIAAGVLILSLGGFIFFQTKKTIKNIAFFFFCLSLGIWLLPSGIVYLSNNADTALWWYKRFVFLGVVNILPCIYLFSVITSGFLKKQKYGVVAAFIFTNSFYIMALTTNKVITSPQLYYWGYYPHYEPITYIFFVGYCLLFFISEVNLWVTYKSETVPIKRAQTLTIFIALIVGFFAFLDFIPKLWGIPLYPLGFIPSSILSFMVAYSVIRHKAFDIETVIHKTLLWISSFSIILIPFFLIYRWILPYIEGVFLGQLIFGTATFVVFTIYLRVFQPKIDHLFQRRKADLEAISSRFIQDLVHLQGFENLIKLIEETIKDALYPQWTNIFIYDQKKKNYPVVNRSSITDRASNLDEHIEFLQWLKKNNEVIYRDFVEIDPEFAAIKDITEKYFLATKAIVVIPLVLNEQLLGVIHLEKKANLERFKAVEFRFLTTLKNQSAIAISNSLIYQDIEEQVKTRTQELVDVQKQLIQAEKLATVGTLSGGVAHEINNPLTAILTNVQMLLAFSEGEEIKADRESLELIEEATQRCRTIVQKLMTYAKKPSESDQASVTDLSKILKKVVAFIEYQLTQDNIEVVIDSQEYFYPVMGNPNELEQVLTNIILNARDAIKEAKKRGHIYITLCKQQHWIEVTIKDEGVGISKEVIAKIFDPFFTTKDVGKGLGLGLSICQSIIEKHKGKITVQSDPGKGSVFTIQLPESEHFSRIQKEGQDHVDTAIHKDSAS